MDKQYILLTNELDIPAWESEGTVIKTSTSINDFEQAYGRIVFIENDGRLGVVPPVPYNHVTTTDESGNFVSMTLESMIGEASSNNAGIVSLNDELITNYDQELDNPSNIYSKIGVLDLIKEFVTGEAYDGPDPILQQADLNAINKKELAVQESNSYTDEVLTNAVEYLEGYSDDNISALSAEFSGELENNKIVSDQYTDSRIEEIREEMINHFVNLITLFPDITEEQLRTALGLEQS